jgi:NAD(P)-dependent dehydrogenase (short-subunit alcohol dehydrogenase family)
MFNIHTETNLTSVAVVTWAFKDLLHKSTDPKVISVSSGLGSITNTLSKKMGRAPPYGASKIGMNGLMAHLQTQEKDRAVAEEEKGEKGDPVIRYYVVSPGALKTAFSKFHPTLKDPNDGAEVITQLVVDEARKYPGGTYWEFVDGEMKEVPW